MAAPGDEIMLPGRSGSPTPVITPAREDGGPGLGVCSLCLSGPGKYTCPRCNAPYCSLACYKGPRHTACSELFYRECVVQMLREEEAEPRGRKELEEMLLRLREEEDGGTDLGRMVDGEEAELWNRLTAQEKDQFTRLLQSGDIGALVPQWKPWWHPGEIRHKMILELPEGADGSDKPRIEMADKAPDAISKTPEVIEDPSPNANTEGQKKGEDPGVHDQATGTSVPPVLSSIPPLCSLSRNPSPLVKYTVVNVIYGYAFSLLRHNGDVSDADILLDFTGTLLSVSAALSTNAVYNSTPHALKSAVRAASDPQAGGERGLACSAMEATSQILHGDGTKTYSLAALSHLFRLLGKVRKHVASDKDIRKGAFSAKKKCLFLAAWVKENEDCLGVLSMEIMAEYKQYLDELSGVAEISKGLQKVWGGKRPQEKKKLVQEVSLPTENSE
ncbi:PREDICTED: zinc finger HIT domain-containing protein 2 [Nanorana parkeri]|uniref:zinc finger HIT domain-containing protein 2 n=1 Tax=Nanorana parkeri TaxID=125878 RepID=UPI0008546EA8|nr:PREDICTED: zinc finger HIT domain-containing protein 2 [Nanorana parkeri]